ncbi:MAG TPA: hypothetical protein VLE27_12985 [Thermoanaerobaculia bacterium]|nr:hypothetical protein [Thermoanaerobaculia bacterium]
MSSELSLSQILANLEAKIASHRQKEAHHAEQEVFHREQRALQAAELATSLEHYEAFKAVAGPAAEIAASFTPAAPPQVEKKKVEEVPPTTVRSKLVSQVVATLPAAEVFSPSRISTEINRRYGKHLRRPASARMVSNALRRLAAEGEVRLVQEGAPYHEALYTKG